MSAEAKAALYDRMTAVARASGFRSLTRAIAEAFVARDEIARLRDALVQADLTIRSFPGTDQSDVEFIRRVLDSKKAPAA